MEYLALYNKDYCMALIYNDALNYGPAIYSDSADSKKIPDLKHSHAEPTLEKYRNFLKDIIQALTAPSAPYTIKNIEHILEKYGVNEDSAHIKNDNVLNVINNLQKMKLQNSEEVDVPDYENKTVNDIAETLGSIRNEIRKQTLYRKSASAQFTASTSALEKEFSTNDPITTGTSYAEIWLRLAMFIGEIKEDYVDFYADLMQKYTEMYESFNENVQKASSEAVSTGDDGNNVSFDTGKMQAGYDAFQKDVDRLNGELGSVDGWSSMTDDEKRRMTITLEPAYKVDSNGKISFNMDQYHSVSGTYPSGINNGKVSTASYQAWLATFNAAGNAFQSNMQSFAQRYSQANNNFDTLNKILSSAISTMAESARDVLKSLS